jgi:hypothetical protein
MPGADANKTAAGPARGRPGGAKPADRRGRSFGQGFQFDDFYRVVQNHGATLAQKDSTTPLVLPPDSAYLQQTRGTTHSIAVHAGHRI